MSVLQDPLRPSETRAYLRELEARLVGPRRAKRSLVREAGDHLVDATEAYVVAGHHPCAAGRMAVADFGTVDEVAPGFQTTLSVAAARRTSWLLVAVLCVQPMLWDRGLMLAGDPAAPPPEGALFGVLDHAVEYGGTVTVALALLALLATGVGNRWHHAGRGIVRTAAIFALVVCAVLPVLSSSMVIILGLPGSGPTWAAMAVLLFLPLALTARSARRCLAAASAS